MLSYTANDKPVWHASDKSETVAKHSSPINAPSASHRLHVLRTFYYQVAESLLLTSDDLDFVKKEKCTF